MIKAIILCALIMLVSATVYAQDITLKYYTASWCGWCAKQAPIVDQIEKDYKVKVERIQAEDRVVPVIEIWVNGKLIKEFVGFTPYIAIVPYL